MTASQPTRLGPAEFSEDLHLIGAEGIQAGVRDDLEMATRHHGLPPVSWWVQPPTPQRWRVRVNGYADLDDDPAATVRAWAGALAVDLVGPRSGVLATQLRTAGPVEYLVLGVVDPDAFEAWAYPDALADRIAAVGEPPPPMRAPGQLFADVLADPQEPTP